MLVRQGVADLGLGRAVVDRVVLGWQVAADLKVGLEEVVRLAWEVVAVAG